MSPERVTSILKQAVSTRAKNYCEYCRSPGQCSTESFTVDHIKPRKAGGENTLTEGRENQEPDFLIFHNGKWGILEVDGEVDEERDRHFQSHGISIIQYYDSTLCSEQPDLVVQEFLEMLNQV